MSDIVWQKFSFGCRKTIKNKTLTSYQAETMLQLRSTVPFPVEPSLSEVMMPRVGQIMVLLLHKYLSEKNTLVNKRTQVSCEVMCSCQPFFSVRPFRVPRRFGPQIYRTRGLLGAEISTIELSHVWNFPKTQLPTLFNAHINTSLSASCYNSAVSFPSKLSHPKPVKI